MSGPVTRAHKGRTTVLLLRPFQTFFELESAGSILLLGCTVLALLWANSPFAESYFHLWETEVTVGTEAFRLTYSLHHWINDGLMAAFFFVIGLEIKREVLLGELSSPRQAAFPLAGAVGGMLVPAALYVAFNAGRPTVAGWGIPMATDIAFALGILSLLGSRAPLGLKVFLTALAIVDDLGAVLVIALFYTAEVSGQALAAAAVCLAAMMALNRMGVRHPLVYFAFGLGLWVAFLKSGVHATIAGVLGALTIPTTRKLDTSQFLSRAREYLAEFAEDVEAGPQEPTTDQRDAVYSLERASQAVLSPLAVLEHAMHPWVAWVIIPIFALANAGVALGGGVLDTLTSPIGLGVVTGLVIGKQVGVMLFCVLAVRLGWAALPAETTWRQLYGVACLCGIGFTMSLFIAGLALGDGAMLDAAKTGILAGSLVSGVVGYAVLARSGP